MFDRCGTVIPVPGPSHEVIALYARDGTAFALHLVVRM